MKKQAILILIVLPFFLVFLIVGVGEIFRAAMLLGVQEIYFLDSNGERIDIADYTLEFLAGESYEVGYCVVPQNASDRDVDFSADDDKISFENRGFANDDKTVGTLLIVCTQKTGYTTLTMQTKDKTKRASIRIRISEPSYVTDIVLKQNKITLMQSTAFNLQEDTDPFVSVLPVSLPASLRILSFVSSNETIAAVRTIAGRVRVYALSQGKCEITVLHELESGETLLKTMEIEVKSNPLSWNLAPLPSAISTGLASSGLEILLQFSGEEISPSNIELSSYDEVSKTYLSQDKAYLSQNKLIINTSSGAFITITATFWSEQTQYNIQSTLIII